MRFEAFLEDEFFAGGTKTEQQKITEIKSKLLAIPFIKFNEINQGFIPSEKIRLSKNGITTDPNFGNGVSDLISGNLSIHVPDN